VYKIDDNGVLSLIPNQPIKTQREASRVLGIHNSKIRKLIDSSEVHKGLVIYSSPVQNEAGIFDIKKTVLKDK
jgi:hypothetical protein